MPRAEKKLAEIRAKEELAKIKLEKQKKQKQDLEEAKEKWAAMPAEQKRNVKIVGIIIGVVVLIGFISALGSDDTSTTANTNQQTEQVTSSDAQPEVVEEKTPKQQLLESILALTASKQAFDSGSYVKGDIPAGEYAFVSIDDSSKYYSEEDEAGNIVDNENFSSFGYVYVHGVGNLTTRGVLIPASAYAGLGVTGAKDIYEKLNETSGFNGAAMYKVGVDIQPGQYTLQSTGEAYTAILSGPVGNNEIIDNENFNGRYAVSLRAGQYLTINRGEIVQ